MANPDKIAQRSASHRRCCRRLSGLCSRWHLAVWRSVAHGSDARVSVELSARSELSPIAILRVHAYGPPPAAEFCAKLSPDANLRDFWGKNISGSLGYIEKESGR